MYTFLKERDKSNQFDLTEVKHTSDAVTSSELSEAFYNFMLGCGYSSGAVISGFQTVIDQYGQEEEND